MRPARSRTKWLAAGALAVVALVGGVWLFFSDAVKDYLPAPLQRLVQSNNLPAWLIVGNGRLEATEIDVATKLAGRLAEVVPREGDIVEAGAVVARLDTAALEAQLRQAEAELKRAQRETEYALAIVEQRRSERDYADLELRRQVELEQRNFAALYFKRRNVTYYLEEAVAAGKIDAAQAFSR